jgi:hypothetical protein
MIESPVLQELKAEWTRDAVVDVLVARFGQDAEELQAELDKIDEPERLKELVKFAALCHDLEAFREHLVARDS